jgi:Tfp pilus assembly protein PilO
MKRISKQKQNQLILVGLATALMVVGLWYSLIRFQQAGLQKLESSKKAGVDQLAQIQETIKNSREIEAELLVVSNKLAIRENDMASGDLYSSMVNSIRKFKVPYKVDIPQFSSGGAAADVNLLPKFPYKQVAISISGTAHYYDLGKFVAEFENQFPSCRVLNLELVPASASGPEEREKLSFRMDIVSLVKAGGTRPANTP